MMARAALTQSHLANASSKTTRFRCQSAITSASGPRPFLCSAIAGYTSGPEELQMGLLRFILDIVDNIRNVPGFITLLSDVSHVPLAHPDQKGEP